jgi:hypothetical protein
MAKRKPHAQFAEEGHLGEREPAPQLPPISPGPGGAARSESRVPTCFKCGHPIEDGFTESLWSDAEERYVGFCRRCQLLDACVLRAMQEVHRRYFEVAIERIPKKKKPVAA